MLENLPDFATDDRLDVLLVVWLSFILMYRIKQAHVSSQDLNTMSLDAIT